jgi:PAS domain S-box-containing protein
MPWGSHLCLFYETKEDLVETLVPYFKTGLENNEYCVWAISEPLKKAEVLSALSRAIPDFERYRAEGSIEVLPGRQWYLKGNTVDMKRITAGWENKIHQALAKGRDGIRVSGNAFWIKTNQWPDFIAYERELGEAFAYSPMLALCTYPLNATRAVDVLDVARAHQFTVAIRRGEWERIETPELKQANEQIRRLNEALESRVIERTRQLSLVNDQLKAQIAERARIEERLRLSEASLAEGQRLTHTGSWTWNVASGKVTWSSEHFVIFGFEPGRAEPTFQHVMERVHPEDRAELERVLGKAITDRADFDHSFRLLLPDGSLKYVQSLGHAITAASGELEYVGTVMDVSERTRAEQALAQAQGELERAARLTTFGVLAASIAHEINQPLAAIVTNSEASLRWLGNDTPNFEEATDALNRIVRDAARASRVIQHIRALVKEDKTEHVQLDLNEVIDDVLVLIRGQLQHRRVVLRTELAESLPPVFGDRVQLQQLIMNLVVNGIEAMSALTDRQREVVIRSEVTKTGNVVVSVEDAGIGLDPAMSERLFDPFFTTKSGGMGMGLSISRSIAESHGGRLSVSPRSPHGTVFRFTLPSRAGAA